MRWIIAVTVLLCAFDAAMPAAAQGNQTAEMVREAFAEWQAASDRWREEGLSEAVGPMWSGEMYRVDPELAARVMTELQPALDLYRAAIRRGDADFVDANTSSWVADSSHLSMLRALQFSLRWDMDYRTLNGDMTRVGRDLAEMIAASKLLGDDGPLSESTIATLLWATAIYQTQRAIDYGYVDRAAAQVVLEACNESLDSDVMGWDDAIRRDGERNTEWMLKLSATDEGRAELIRHLITSDGPTAELDHAETFAAMSAADLEAAIHGYSGAMREIAEATAIQDLTVAQAKVEEIQRAIDQGVFGPIAREHAALAGIMSTRRHTTIIAEDARAELRIIATRPDGRTSLMNAAAVYRHAFGAYDLLPPEVRRVFDPKDAERNWNALRPIPVDEHGEAMELPAVAIDEALAAAADVIDWLNRAATIPHCDFNQQARVFFVERTGLWPGSVWEVQEMVPCLSILQHSLDRAIEENDSAIMLERTRTLLAAVDHLAQYPLFDSVILSFETLESLAETLENAELPPGLLDHDDTLQEVLARFNTDDPCGLRRAIEHYGYRAHEYVIPDFERPSQREQFAGRMRHLHRASKLVPADDGALMAEELEAMDPPLIHGAFKRVLRFAEHWATRFGSCGDDIDAVAAAEIELGLALDDHKDDLLPHWYVMAAHPLPLAARALIDSREVWRQVAFETQRAAEAR